MEKARSIARFVQSLKGKVYGYKNISSVKIYEVLRVRKVLYYDENKCNLPYQTFIDKGYFIPSKFEGTNEDGTSYSRNSTLITPKGEEWLLNKLIEHNYIQMK